MTLFHLINCSLLGYAPYIIVFKYSGLNEYTNIWMPTQAGIIYFLIQFIKLLIMATFFPDNTNNLFIISVDISKSIADFFDIIGIYLLVIHFFIGKPEIRCLSVGLGWSFAHSFANYFPSFILGARGTAFDYKYIFSAVQKMT